MPVLPTSLPAQRNQRHRTDSGTRLGQPSTTDPQTKWAVVGGGILGMTLALRLRQRGDSVTLIEAADHLGGLADAWEFGGIEWDRHYHVTLLSDSNLRALLRELDLEEEMHWVETKTGFYTDDQWYSMSSSVEFLRFPPLNLVDKFRLGATIFYASKLKNWRKLEKIPVADWLRKLSGRRVFDKIWLPLLKAKLGDNYQKASAAFIWAIIARMYAARRSGLKKEMFGYLEGGYARFLAALEKKLSGLGVRIHTAAPVTSLVRKGSKFEIETRPDVDLGEFDQVAVTTPAPLAAQACPQISEDELRRLRGIEYQGIVCASVLLNRPLKGYYVTNITDTWVPFTAIIEMTSLVDPKNFDGKSLVYLPKYVDPADPIFDRTDADIESEFTGALLRMIPGLKSEDIAAFRISRVRHVLALSTLNYSDNLPPISTSVPGLHIVNSAHINNGTLNVDETIQLANRAARDLSAAVY